jgi:hypothetical protein
MALNLLQKRHDIGQPPRRHHSVGIVKVVR